MTRSVLAPLVVALGLAGCRGKAAVDAGDTAGTADGGGADGANGTADGADGGDGSDGSDGTEPVDADGDGFPASEDCDDEDPAIHPDASELCNGADDDCDGETDEGVTLTFWADADGDGVGDPAASVEACALEEGLVDNADDCDDSDPAVNPSAEEVCNEIDDDCDSGVDEGVTTTFYVDADEDGWGDADLTVEACARGAGYAADPGDCDEADPAVNPSATEVCNEIDDDCDGDIDDADADLDASTGDRFYVDGDGDGYGDAANTVQACEAPSGAVANADDCDDGDGAISPDGVEVCDGADNDCEGTVDGSDAIDALSWFVDDDGDGYGDASATVRACSQPSNGTTDATDCHDTDATAYPGSHETETPGDGIDTDCDGRDLCDDLNCDGWPDIVFAEYYDNSTYVVDSTVYYGSASGYSAADSLDLTTTGASGVAADDLDGDGYVDLVFSSYYDGNYVTDSRVYWGSASGHSTSDVTDLYTVGAIDVCTHDLDGDGYAEIIFPQYYDGSSYGPGSRIYWGSSSGYSTADVTDVTTWAPRSCDVGDVDADGYPDLLFSGYYYTASTGYAYLYWGSSGGYSTSDISYFSGGRFANGHLVDVDDDGYDDVLLPNYYDGNYTTYSQLWYGSSSGVSSSDRDTFLTYGAWDAAVGDFDADGRNDVVFNSYYNGSSYAGNYTRLFYQGATGFTSSNLATVRSQGSRRITAADVDGDGYDDLVQGSLRSSASAFEVDSYVYNGSSSGVANTGRTDLATAGTYTHTVGDLDGDGYLELIFANYMDDTGDRQLDSRIYWGSASGYAATNATDLPVDGPWRAPIIVGSVD